MFFSCLQLFCENFTKKSGRIFIDIKSVIQINSSQIVESARNSTYCKPELYITENK